MVVPLIGGVGFSGRSCGAVGVHRTGRVPVGGTAVVVVAVAPHRDAAFAGARDLIDRIKAEAWIWKKELRSDGEVWIEGC